MAKSTLYRKFAYFVLVIYLLRSVNRYRLTRLCASTKTKPTEPTDAAVISKTIVVATSKGQVRGFVDRSPHSGRAVWNFRGIPYAESPTGECRFKHPVEKKPWYPNVLDCLRFGYRSVQNPHLGVEVPILPKTALLKKLLYLIFFGWGINRNPFDAEPLDVNQSENCLTLSVSSPENAVNLPVVCFIHGGAFELGHSSEELYASTWGNPFVDRDVIYVGINYRLGVFGYVKVADGDYNNGLADQIEALKWIKQEIAAFGGDPNRVTVMGHSAGAFSCGAILSSPKAHGFFNRAILMSGAAANAVSKQEHERLRMAFAKTLKLDLTDLTTANLSKFTTAQILAAQLNIAKAIGPLSFQPIIDEDYVFDFPIRALSYGATRDVDVMIGCTKEEAKLFKPLFFLVPFSQWSMTKFLEPFVGMLGLHSNREECQELTQSLVEQYTNWFKETKPNMSMADHSELFFKFASEFIFDAPATLLCESHADMKNPGKKTFRYRFDYKGPLGAVHGIELPFVFGTYVKWKTSELMQRLIGHDLSDPRFERLSNTMIDAWANFVKTGDASTKDLTWPNFTRANRETCLFTVDGGWIASYQAKDRDGDYAFDFLVQHREKSDKAFGIFSNVH